MNFLRSIAYRLRDFLIGPLERGGVYDYSPPASQLQLAFTYRVLAASGAPLPSLADVGFKVHSQSDEDGILLYIFSLIGSTNKKCVEICAGDGIECNTANLILNHGWTGLLVDGNPKQVAKGREFYRLNRNTYVYPPTFVHSWITRGNVNDLIRENGFEGEIDLFSLDMDGMDYWIWDAIEVIDPRVVVVEYQDILGPERAWTAPYQDDFSAQQYPRTRGFPDFGGASLPAFLKLAKKKGYRLVGCNRYGYNAFFVRGSLGQSHLPEIPVEDCFQHPKAQWGMKERYPTAKDLPWVEL